MQEAKNDSSGTGTEAHTDTQRGNRKLPKVAYLAHHIHLSTCHTELEYKI